MQLQVAKLRAQLWSHPHFTPSKHSVHREAVDSRKRPLLLRLAVFGSDKIPFVSLQARLFFFCNAVSEQDLFLPSTCNLVLVDQLSPFPWLLVTDTLSSYFGKHYLCFVLA